MNLDIALAVALIFSAACYALMGVRLLTSRREVGTLPVGLLFIVIGFWVIGGAVELLSESFLMFSIGRTGHFVGTALVPVVIYACFREYTGEATTGSRLAVLLIIPIISISLAATNASHELMWYGPFLSDAGEFLTRPENWGPWFLFAHLPYSYLVTGAAVMTLLAHSSEVGPAHRRGLFLMVVACAGPLVATAAYDAGVGSDTVSYVPLVFAGLLPFYAWLILGEKILEFSPLAYETVFQNMQDPVVVVDEQQRVIGLNRTAENMLSVSETEALRSPLESLLGSDAPEVFAALDTGAPQKMMTATGRFLHIQVSPIESGRASVHGGKVLMFRDVSDVEHAQSEVRKNEKLLRTLIDHSVNGVVRFSRVEDKAGDTSPRCIFANAAAGKFLGAGANELTGFTAEEIIRSAVSGTDDDFADDVVGRFVASVEGGKSLEIEIRQDRLGSAGWLRVICEPVGDDIAATFVDITDTKAKERHMKSIATSDPLTGVLNRRGFEGRAARRLTQSDDDATGALLFIDLNEFKGINDRFGHEVGDELLKIAAERLRKSLRSCDIIGRPGGDEFVALVPDVNAETADKLAKRLTASLEESYNIGSRRLECRASIGLALYPENASTLTGLLREADQAMYRAKARSRGVTGSGGDDLLEKAM